jgi:molecular chaperone GrpE (heat shock protein)
MKNIAHNMPSTASGDSSKMQRLAAELQAARLELVECAQIIERLHNEVERLNDEKNHQAQSAWTGQMEALFTELSGPVSQVETQLHLSRDQGMSLSTSDVLAVSQRLVRILYTAGMEREGAIGQTVFFDPSRHMPLSGQVTLQPGDSVVVRSAGVKYQGKIIRKAGVEKGV